MIRLLIRLLLLLGLIYLLHRCWQYLHHAVRQSGGLPPKNANPPRDLVLDPECGVHILRDDALTAEVRGELRHFCSRECRDVYLARNR